MKADPEADFAVCGYTAPRNTRAGFGALHLLSWVRKPSRGDDEEGDPPPVGSGKLTSLEFVKEMVANGAKINLPSKTGLNGRGILNKPGATPFLAAASTADVPLLELLIELGADPLLANAQRTTPLLAAAGVGVVVRALADLGAPGDERVRDLLADAGRAADTTGAAVSATAVPAWPLLAALGGLLLAAGGLGVVLWSRRWPTMSARYERAASGRAEVPAAPTEAALWDALDAGADPTADRV
jgi:hypothetical protein